MIPKRRPLLLRSITWIDHADSFPNSTLLGALIPQYSINIVLSPNISQIHHSVASFKCILRGYPSMVSEAARLYIWGWGPKRAKTKSSAQTHSSAKSQTSHPITDMANLSLSCCLALLLIFFSSKFYQFSIGFSVKRCLAESTNALSFPVADGCMVAVIGGGCPNPAACVETCRPCYKGIGEVKAFCRPAGGGIPYDQCICSFAKGAPCNPPGCPKSPPYVNSPQDSHVTASD